MIEYRNIKTSPDKETYFTKQMVAFGYKYEGSREVYNEGVRKTGETVTYNKNTGVVYNTSTHFENTFTNYITMNFSRDNKMPHYAELVALEEEWDKLYEKTSAPNPPVLSRNAKLAAILLFIFGGIWLLMGIIMGAAMSEPGFSAWGYTLGMTLPIAIGCFVGGYFSNKKNKKAIETYNAQMDKFRKEAAEAYAQMDRLVSKGIAIIDGE